LNFEKKEEKGNKKRQRYYQIRQNRQKKNKKKQQQQQQRLRFKNDNNWRTNLWSIFNYWTTCVCDSRKKGKALPANTAKKLHEYVSVDIDKVTPHCDVSLTKFLKCFEVFMPLIM